VNLAVTEFASNARKRPPVQVQLPELSVDKVCRLRSIEPLEIQHRDGNVSVHELAILISLIEQFKPKRIFEFGTFDGRTTLNMAAAASDAIVYTLDLPRSHMNSTNLPITELDKKYIDKNISGERFLGSKYEGRIIQLYGDSSTFEYAPYFGSIDFVFVDGAHSFEYVISDSMNALRMLTSRGVILWHDYASWPAVTRALNLLYNEGQPLHWIKGTALVMRIAAEYPNDTNSSMLQRLFSKKRADGSL
jgi:predicted O-methyltransferase YrrM